MKASHHIRHTTKMVGVAGAITLAACSHTEPAVRVEIQRVEVPVPIRCIDPQDVPAPVPPVGTLPSDARNAADILAAAVLQLRAADRELRALIQGCVS